MWTRDARDTRPKAELVVSPRHGLLDGTEAGARARNLLSRDSPVDQRIDISLAVQGFDGRVDFAIKCFGIGECLMGQMV
ncbi:MAG: hypothetical protein WB610_13990, partial [Rhodomicrobium sp.]